MRGPDVMQDTLFAVRSLESYVPADHPLRPVRDILNEALKRMDPLFAAMYAPAGRDSIAPEKLLRALMLQVLYGVRSERMVIEQLGYNLLFRWFVGVSMQDDPWDHSTFSKNRDRLIEHDACTVLFEEVLAQARGKGLLSAEHFSVDGTLVRAWASNKSFVPKDGPPPPASGSKSNPEVNFRGPPRTNDTHESRTDPDSRLYRKSKNAEALPYFMGHALMENRNGLVVDHRLTHATGKAEREAAIEMLAAQPGAARKTVGADKGYDTADFVADCRAIGVTPHVAQNTKNRASAIDERTTRHPGYAVSQIVRKLIETIFGDGKQHGTLRQLKLRGLDRAELVFAMTMTAVNLRRMPKLFAESG
ncbi:MAG: IS5 family transposase [Betaproteobacteria bacterium]|nr:IS5 family transposase [Betaproteobacteria bacterium]MBK7080562.1 IS5 family transposase [Betaproteobacteria bacterium]MBK9676126.1 IS5 family transposase [Betaproteobacteria bacterium]MBK9704205.1 IS5 family transposase [Betaproteobacteria bacterium]